MIALSFDSKSRNVASSAMLNVLIPVLNCLPPPFQRQERPDHRSQARSFLCWLNGDRDNKLALKTRTSSWQLIVDKKWLEVHSQRQLTHTV